MEDEDDAGGMAFKLYETETKHDDKTKKQAETKSVTKLPLKVKENHDKWEPPSAAQLAAWQKEFKLGSCLPQSVLDKLPADAKHQAKQGWLVAGDTGLMCIACKRAGLKGAWGNGTAGRGKQIRSWFLKHHAEDSLFHYLTILKNLCQV